MNFYPFHIGDYISHTSHLSDLEDLAYRRMMDLYYQHEKPFYQSLDIARKIKSTQAIVDQLLPEFFEWNEEDKSWHSKRADEEIAKYRAKADSARNANRIKSEKITVLKSALKSEPHHNVTKNQEPITINHKPKITTPEGVSESLFKDYLEVRKAKKAKWTETAYKGLQREADKAKMSLSDVMQMCCERGWAGFKAEWVQETAKSAKELPLGTNEQIMHAYEHECGKDPKQARFNSYYEMKAYIVQQREIRAKS
jgi:uncharacterized protein YdaU (DUF1376 family)